MEEGVDQASPAAKKVRLPKDSVNRATLFPDAED